MSLAQGNNTPTRPRIEPGSPDLESDTLTTRPVRPHEMQVKGIGVCLKSMSRALTMQDFTLPDIAAAKKKTHFNIRFHIKSAKSMQPEM